MNEINITEHETKIMIDILKRQRNANADALVELSVKLVTLEEQVISLLKTNQSLQEENIKLFNENKRLTDIRNSDIKDLSREIDSLDKSRIDDKKKYTTEINKY